MYEGLMVHCGGEVIPRPQLEMVPTPEGTSSWCPIPHIELLDEIDYALGRLPDISVEKEEHALNHNGDEYFGLLHISRESQYGEIYETVIGVRNAHNKKFSAGIVIGKSVFVCDNLCFSGDVRLTRKHTPKISVELPGLIREATTRLLGIAERDDDRTTAYIGTRLAQDRAAHALLQIHESGGVPAQAIGKIWQEYKTPSHDEHLNEYGDQTVWTLAQALTQVHRPTAMNILTEYPTRTIKQNRVLDAIAGVDYQTLAA